MVVLKEHVFRQMIILYIYVDINTKITYVHKDVHNSTNYDLCATVDCVFMRSYFSFHMGGGSVYRIYNSTVVTTISALLNINRASMSSVVGVSREE